jgi:hypothetical protein
MLTPAGAAAVVSALLRDLDRAADLVECALAPDGLGFRVQIRIHGDITRVGHFHRGLLTVAAAGNAVATRVARLVLQALLLDVETRRAHESARRTLHRRPPRRTPPPAPP